MAVLDRAALKAAIDLVITTNGTNAITGSVLNGILTDISDSLANLTSDLSLIGLNEYDPAVTYDTGVGVIFESNLYQAAQDGITGAFAEVKWLKLTNNSGSTNFDFDPYDNSTTYDIGDRVLFQERFFISDVNGTVGILPDDAAAEWTEISANNGAFANPYVAGTFYLNDDVVQDNGFLFQLAIATPPSFESLDLAAEIISGEWVSFNATGGIVTGTEGNYPRINGAGQLADDDDVKANLDANPKRLDVGGQLGGIQLVNAAIQNLFYSFKGFAELGLFYDQNGDILKLLSRGTSQDTAMEIAAKNNLTISGGGSGKTVSSLSEFIAAKSEFPFKFAVFKSGTIKPISFDTGDAINTNANGWIVRYPDKPEASVQVPMFIEDFEALKDKASLINRYKNGAQSIPITAGENDGIITFEILDVATIPSVQTIDISGTEITHLIRHPTEYQPIKAFLTLSNTSASAATINVRIRVSVDGGASFITNRSFSRSLLPKSGANPSQIDIAIIDFLSPQTVSTSQPIIRYQIDSDVAGIEATVGQRISEVNFV